MVFGSSVHAGPPKIDSQLFGGWFGPLPSAPDAPLDTTVLTEEDYWKYVAGLERNGFFGPDSWYMNAERNMAFAKEAKNDGRIDLPVLFLHGAYDWVAETRASRLAEPMRAACADLIEVVAETGHWMAQERPDVVNAALARWLAAKAPEVWPA